MDKERLQAFHEWTVGSALPAWSTLGFDASAGRFRERLDERGAPIDVPHRAMVQARQIYVYSHAYLLGWHDRGAELAEQAMTSLRRDCVASPRAKPARVLDRRTRRVGLRNARRVHACVRAIRHRLAPSCHGGRDPPHACGAHRRVRQGAPRRCTAWRPVRRASDDRAHEAAEPTHAPARGLPRARACGAWPGWLAAPAVVALFLTRLFDRRRGVVLEHFAEDWSAHPGESTQRIERSRLEQVIGNPSRAVARAARGLLSAKNPAPAVTGGVPGRHPEQDGCRCPTAGAIP